MNAKGFVTNAKKLKYALRPAIPMNHPNCREVLQYSGKRGATSLLP